MHGGGGSIPGLLPSQSSSVYTTLRFTYTELTCVYLTRGFVLSRPNVPAGTGFVWSRRVLGRGKLGIHKSVWYTQLSDLCIPKSAKVYANGGIAYTQLGRVYTIGRFAYTRVARYTQTGGLRIPKATAGCGRVHPCGRCSVRQMRPDAPAPLTGRGSAFAD